MRKIFISLSILACVMASASLGLFFSPYLAKRLGFAPFKQATAEREAIPGVMVELITASKESVVLSSENLDNLLVLNALVDAGKRGVAVGVVLSGPTNPAGAGASAWLAERGITVRRTEAPIRGTILVVDKTTVATSSSAMLSKAALNKEQSILFVFEHKQTAQSFFESIRKQGVN